MNKKNQSIFFVLLASVLGGGIAPLSKLALGEFSPGVFNLLRFLLATVILLPIFFYKKIKLDLADIKKLFFVSLFATANTTLFIFGLKYTTAGSSQILYAAVPLIVSCISYFFIQETFSPRRLIGLILGFLGLVAIIFAPLFEKNPFSSQYILGNLLIFAGVITFSFYTVMSKKLLVQYSSVVMTLAFVTTTVVLQLLLLPFISTPINFSPHISVTGLWSLLYVGIIGMAIYYLIYQHTIKISTPTIASASLYLQPIFAIILARLLLGEQLTFALLFGGVVVFISVWLITKEQKLN